MNRHKFLLAVLLTAVSLCAAAQGRDYRDPGYKGGIALTDQLGVFVGAETTHGFMLGRKDYIGIGANAFVLPKKEDMPVYAQAFAQYRHYFEETGRSMFGDLKAGYSHAFGYETNGGVTYSNAILAEPGFGWSWTLGSGCGLSLGLGVTVLLPIGENRTEEKILALPKLALGFEF